MFIISFHYKFIYCCFASVSFSQNALEIHFTLLSEPQPHIFCWYVSKLLKLEILIKKEKFQCFILAL